MLVTTTTTAVVAIVVSIRRSYSRIIFSPLTTQYPAQSCLLESLATRVGFQLRVFRLWYYFEMELDFDGVSRNGGVARVEPIDKIGYLDAEQSNASSAYVEQRSSSSASYVIVVQEMHS